MFYVNVTFYKATIHSKYISDSKVYSESCDFLNYNRTAKAKCDWKA